MPEVNAPVADAAPSSVLLLLVVGFVEVLQQTPYWVGFGTPKSVIFPFPVAVVVAIEETACVVTVGALSVENDSTPP